MIREDLENRKKSGGKNIKNIAKHFDEEAENYDNNFINELGMTDL